MPYPWNHFFHILVFYILLQQQHHRQQHHEARFPSEKKKVETQIGQIGANQENWAASIARAGAREPPWGSGSPRLRRRRRRNKRRSPQPSTARSAREGRRSESSCEFFCPPPFPPLPSPPADDRSPRFGPSVKSWDCPPSTWLTLPTRRNGVLLLLNSKTCVCSLSLSLSLSLSRRKYKLKVATVKCRSCKIQWSCKITCETSFLCPPRATSDPADPVNRSPVP